MKRAARKTRSAASRKKAKAPAGRRRKAATGRALTSRAASRTARKGPARRKTAAPVRTGKKTAVRKKTAAAGGSRTRKKKAPLRSKTATARTGKKTAVRKKTAAAGGSRSLKKKAPPPRKTAAPVRSGKKTVTRRKVQAPGKGTVRLAVKPTLAPAPPADGISPVEKYQKALKGYAACMELLQQKRWKAASQALAAFIAEHSTQVELFERARMYLRVCAQHLDEADMRPRDFDERCSLAVLHANRGQFGRALRHLKQAIEERPDSDKAHYLMASTLALKGERRAALASLRKAIDLDDRNRIHASHDPDFTVLRDDETFITLTTREDEDI